MTPFSICLSLLLQFGPLSEFRVSHEHLLQKIQPGANGGGGVAVKSRRRRAIGQG